MNESLIKEIGGIKKVFPKAKYIESEEPDITDDMIYLTDKLHIQVDLFSDFYSLIEEVEENGCILFKYLIVDKDLQKVFKEAIKIVAVGGTVGMN